MRGGIESKPSYVTRYEHSTPSSFLIPLRFMSVARFIR